MSSSLWDQGLVNTGSEREASGECGWERRAVGAGVGSPERVSDASSASPEASPELVLDLGRRTGPASSGAGEVMWRLEAEGEGEGWEGKGWQGSCQPLRWPAGAGAGLASVVAGTAAAAAAGAGAAAAAAGGGAGDASAGLALQDWNSALYGRGNPLPCAPSSGQTALLHRNALLHEPSHPTQSSSFCPSLPIHAPTVAALGLSPASPTLLPSSAPSWSPGLPRASSLPRTPSPLQRQAGGGAGLFGASPRCDADLKAFGGVDTNWEADGRKPQMTHAGSTAAPWLELQPTVDPRVTVGAASRSHGSQSCTSAAAPCACPHCSASLWPFLEQSPEWETTKSQQQQQQHSDCAKMLTADSAVSVRSGFECSSSLPLQTSLLHHTKDDDDLRFCSGLQPTAARPQAAVGESRVAGELVEQQPISHERRRQQQQRQQRHNHLRTTDVGQDRGARPAAPWATLCRQAAPTAAAAAATSVPEEIGQALCRSQTRARVAEQAAEAAAEAVERLRMLLLHETAVVFSARQWDAYLEVENARLLRLLAQASADAPGGVHFSSDALQPFEDDAELSCSRNWKRHHPPGLRRWRPQRMASTEALLVRCCTAATRFDACTVGISDGRFAYCHAGEEGPVAHKGTAAAAAAPAAAPAAAAATAPHEQALPDPGCDSELSLVLIALAFVLGVSVGVGGALLLGCRYGLVVVSAAAA